MSVKTNKMVIYMSNNSIQESSFDMFYPWWEVWTLCVCTSGYYNTSARVQSNNFTDEILLQNALVLLKNLLPIPLPVSSTLLVNSKASICVC